jgi:putative membrane protein
MRGFLTRLLITALGLFAASKIVPGGGVAFDGWGSLVVAALLLGIVNAIVRPILILLTLPITLLTLGLFLLVINGISFALVAWFLPGFSVSGLWAATLGAIVVGVTSWFASSFIGSSGRLERFRASERTGH